MKVTETEIEGVVIIEPRVFSDARGCFFESYSERWFSEKVRPVRFVQDNESHSARGVVRGLHYQLPPFAQGKLVRVVSGEILDVAVDIRVGSPTFGKYVGVVLSAENRRQLFVPRGFAHGFAVRGEGAVVQYKCDNTYSPECEGGIRWDDPQLAIDWGLESNVVVLSEKDAQNPLLGSARLFDYSENLYRQ